MHVIFRESHGLEELDTPMDVGQTPADLVVLSYSDSDLGAFAAGWHRGRGPDGDLPSLRLANLVALRHPLSVDTYIEQTLSGAKGILIRLIGGVPYWHYGLQQVRALAQAKGIALAVLPADGRRDSRLDEISTLPVSTLRRLAHLCDIGGEVAAQAVLGQMALATGLFAEPVLGSKALPSLGAWSHCRGVFDPKDIAPKTRPRIVLVFYRSYLVAADTAPFKAMSEALEAKGYDTVAIYAPSLKAPEAATWLRDRIHHIAPDAIINATSFSGKGADGTSPLDSAGVTVFQVALSTARRKDWDQSDRGLSSSDLVMHVVLPEVDGRIMGGVVSFKEPGRRDPHLEYSRFGHRPEAECIAAVVNRIDGWLRLARLDTRARRCALILSTYPGKDWNLGHAVGLDAPQSAHAILSDLARAGYDVSEAPSELSEALLRREVAWPVSDYKAALDGLPKQLQNDLTQAWGAPEDDPAVMNGAFRIAAVQCGTAWIGLQPERSQGNHSREEDYHNLNRTPCHAYVAFYLWLRERCDALIHIGAHGTLEWLPGKSVALSPTCWPVALVGNVPVVYPFIVNDPGEAAQAKRRIGAITLGHIPPPLRVSGTPMRLVRLEALLDEFSNADGLDPRRRDRLQSDIRAEAQALGLEDDLGLNRAGGREESITRIDRFVCDVKDSQFGVGLHIWGRPAPHVVPFDTETSIAAERQSLLDALDGKRIAAGPSGSPYRGRADVLPTGRNMFTTDPRSVPTRAAYAQGVKLAEELLRRHLQDEGNWPSGLVADLWGSATMRTAGEEFAMALHLLGCKPVWNERSQRVSGIEVLPITELDRPRIDVTLRVSGLFRDVFPTLSALFAQAVRALAKRDEAPDWNPFVGRSDTSRVYGPAPGSFGLGMNPLLNDYSEDARRSAGEAWLSASAWALDGDKAEHDAGGIQARVEQADSFVHLQDLPETDLLLASDYATHEAGFAAAKSLSGGTAVLWHLDNTNPDAPRTRSLSEEIALVVQARAANPAWIAGMKAHGFRGAAEIASTLEHMAAFAHLSGVVGSHLFDLYHDATLGNGETRDFLREVNPDAYRAMCDCFATLLDAGLWHARRNSIRTDLKSWP